MRLGDDMESAEKGVFVKFNCPISGHLIPMEAMGKQAVVEGTLTAEVVTEDEARHLAEDAGKSAEEIAKIMGDSVRLRVASPAARIFGIEAAVEMPKATSQPK